MLRQSQAMAASTHQKTSKTNGLLLFCRGIALFKRSYWSGQGEQGKGCQCPNSPFLWLPCQSESASDRGHGHESDRGHVNGRESDRGKGHVH